MVFFFPTTETANKAIEMAMITEHCGSSSF
jgi:hypothetical protein